MTGWPKQHKSLSHSSGVEKSKIKMLADLVSDEGSLLHLQLDVSLVVSSYGEDRLESSRGSLL